MNVATHVLPLIVAFMIELASYFNEPSWFLGFKGAGGLELE